VLVGLTCCGWPLIVGLIGFLIGRYRPRFRSPISVDRDILERDDL